MYLGSEVRGQKSEARGQQPELVDLQNEKRRLLLGLRLTFRIILDKDRKIRVEALPAKHYIRAELPIHRGENNWDR